MPMPLTAKQLLKASVVPNKSERVYTIGSFARRVNFVAQQKRALNLIWALHEVGRIENKMRVAVIGGGLAGVTAAAALVGLGATVDLFEKGGRVLHSQRKTFHRRVHPTINAWPFETISLATDLPFYDWSAGACSDVAEYIASDFEKMMESKSFQIHTNVVARDLVAIGKKLVRVVTTPAVKLEKVAGFDLVIITIGFGDEVRDESFDSKSYWQNDNLESDRDNDETFQTFLVSGCGDGGLIDTLRIAYAKFNEGQLAFDLAACLCGTPLAQLIRQAEEAAAALPDAELAKGGYVSKLLSSAYIKAANLLKTEPDYEAARNLLEAAAGSFDRVLYIGDKALVAPYSINTKSH
jgi:hypothetical protein